jgi:transposase, IS5 family
MRISACARSRVRPTVICTVAKVHDINAAEVLLHGEETDVHAAAQY